MNAVLALLVSLSHVAPFIASRNLSGNFSARIFMMLKPLNEILHRCFVALAGLMGIFRCLNSVSFPDTYTILNTIKRKFRFLLFKLPVFRFALNFNCTYSAGLISVRRYT